MFYKIENKIIEWSNLFEKIQKSFDSEHTIEITSKNIKNDFSNYTSEESIIHYLDILVNNDDMKNKKFIFKIMSNETINSEVVKYICNKEFEENIYNFSNKYNNRMNLSFEFVSFTLDNKKENWIYFYKIVHYLLNEYPKMLNPIEIKNIIITLNELYDEFDIKYYFPLSRYFKDKKIEHLIAFSDQTKNLSDERFEDKKAKINQLLGRTKHIGKWLRILEFDSIKYSNDKFAKALNNYAYEYKNKILSFKDDKKFREYNETLNLELIEIIKKIGIEKIDENNNIDEDKSSLEPSYALSRLIFYYLLFIYTKNLRTIIIDSQDENIKIKWDELLINKLVIDSKSYGEGIWQLIENSMKHSSGKTAYFGMILRNADIEEKNINSVNENIKNRLEIKKCFLPLDDEKNNNIFNSIDKKGHRIYQDMLEIFVIDDAVFVNENNEQDITYGIIDKLYKDQKNIKYGSVDSIYKIFELDETNYESNTESFYIEHYGMRWLRHHVNRNNGIMIINTPAKLEENNEAYKYIYHNKYTLKQVDDNRKYFINANINSNDLYFTCYNIVLPIRYKVGMIDDSSPKYNKPNDETYFEYTALKDKTYQQIDLALNSNIKLTDNKKELVENLFKEYFIIDGKLIDINDKPLFVNLNFGFIDRFLYVEMIAKCIFLLIKKFKENRNENSNNNKNNGFYLAINFGYKDNNSYDLISEFIRIYSVFYLKQKSEYMKNVQIAVCSKRKIYINEEERTCTDVNFILAGSNLDSAYFTACNYIYYNSESSLPFVPLIDYLTIDEPNVSKKMEKESIVKIYPFELISVGTGEKESNWFLQHMDCEINSEIWSNRIGCKLSDKRVRIGSQLWIDCFYEAELLFHNLGNVRRFAYLIANKIIDKIKETIKFQKGTYNNDVLIIGYENYSTVMIQEIKTLIEKWLFEYKGKNKNSKIESNIKWVILNHQGDIYPSSYSADKITSAFIVVPIGSTMSTFYKIKRKLRLSKGNSNLKFIENICVLAVGNVYSEEYKENNIWKHFIINSNLNGIWKNVVLINENNSPSLDGDTINYCLSGKAEWYDYNNGISNSYNEKELEFLMRPLVHSDKTSTIFNSTYQIKMTGEVSDYYKRFDNENNLKLLDITDTTNCNVSDYKNPFFYYGHIQDYNNHYQFYFNYDRIAEKNEGKIIEWLRKQKTEFKAFNIVVTPLSQTNSRFYKLVLDNMFNNDLHFIHIGINDTGKEDIRTKFSYISDEIKKITDSFEKVNFYYVDDTVYSGRTIDRASKYLHMLLSQSGVAFEKMSDKHNLFTKVILLVNRSSYETAFKWVDNPVEDWLSFINIVIPSYNMPDGKCPECAVQDRYLKLLKRSSDSKLYDYFGKKVNKHKVKKIDEIKELITEPDEEWIAEYHYYNKELVKTIINKVELNEFAVKDKKDLIQFIRLDDYYKRLYTLNDSYLKLIYNNDMRIEVSVKDGKEKSNVEDIRKNMRTTILKMLCSSFDRENKNIYWKITMFISYIKVVSRNKLINNYFIREAVYEILHCILILFLIDKNTDLYNKEAIKECFRNDQIISKYIDIFSEEILDMQNNNISYYKKIFENIRSSEKNDSEYFKLLQLRIFKTLTHRLSMLHSDIIIKESIVDKMHKKLEQISEYKKQQVLDDFMASLKTATMLEDDDTLCYELNDLAQNNEQEEED